MGSKHPLAADLTQCLEACRYGCVYDVPPYIQPHSQTSSVCDIPHLHFDTSHSCRHIHHSPPTSRTNSCSGVDFIKGSQHTLVPTHKPPIPPPVRHTHFPSHPPHVPVAQCQIHGAVDRHGFNGGGDDVIGMLFGVVAHTVTGVH